jgi:hypothetical protein
VGVSVGVKVGVGDGVGVYIEAKIYLKSTPLDL